MINWITYYWVRTTHHGEGIFKTFWKHNLSLPSGADAAISRRGTERHLAAVVRRQGGHATGAGHWGGVPGSRVPQQGSVLLVVWVPRWSLLAYPHEWLDALQGGSSGIKGVACGHRFQHSGQRKVAGPRSTQQQIKIKKQIKSKCNIT